MNKRSKRSTGPESERRAAVQERVQQVQLVLGYGIVACAVVLGFIIGNPAVGIALAALAGFRLVILRRELRRQAAEAHGVISVPTPRGRRQ